MFNTVQKFVEIDPDPDQGGSLSYLLTKKPVANPLKISPLYFQVADVDAFLRIQDKVRPHLLKPYHLKERTAEDIHEHLGERMPIIGARAYTNELDPGTPVAGCLLSFLKNHDSGSTAIKNLNGYPITNPEKPVTAIVQSLCVDPAYAGNKIASIILDTAKQCAQQHGITQIISAIADDNTPSIKAFKAAGYDAFGHGTDPVIGYEKTYYRLTL